MEKGVKQIGMFLNVPLSTFRPRTRDWYIDEFFSRVSEQWDSKKYGKLYRSNIKFKVNHLTKKDMQWLYERCCSSKHFSQCFFGCLKVKNVTPISDVPSAGK